MLGVIATEPVGAAVRAALRLTPAAPVTVPAGTAVRVVLIVKLVLALMPVTTELAGSPPPVTTCPSTRPAVLPVRTVEVPIAPPVGVMATDGTTALTEVPAARPVPARPSPTRRPVRFAVARKDWPETPPAVATLAGVRPLKRT